MQLPVTARAAVGAVFLAGLLGACTGSGSTPAANPSSGAAAACDSVATTLVSATQRYVDGFAVQSLTVSASPPSPSPSVSATPMGENEFSAAITQTRDRLAALRCDLAGFHDTVSDGLRHVHAAGPVARAVLAQLEVSLTGDLTDRPVVRAVKPSDDLTQVLAEAPDGSTLTFRAGTYRLHDPLVLLRSVTIRGVGVDRTLIVGAPADASVLVMTSARVVLQDLTIRRDGVTPGSGIVTGPVAALTLTRVRAEGALADAQGVGGAGVLMSAADGTPPTTPPVSLVVRNSEFVANATAGIAVGGWHRVDVRGSVFRGDRQCGICFLGLSAGTVRSDRFMDNRVGISASGTSHPTIRGNRFTGGDLALQAGDTAAPIVLDNVITSPSRAAMLYTGKSAGRIDGNSCPTGVPGIAVARTAYPYVGHNSCGVVIAR